MREEWRLAALERYEKRYDEIWAGVKDALSRPGDAFTLMGASNYIFSTGGVLWAVDPMFNTPRSGVSLELADTDAVFPRLSFVLLTHNHRDHFDPRLMERYPDLDWIVPDHMEALIPEVCRNHMTVVRPGDELVRSGLRIRAFSSPHFDAGTTLGVPETGYFVDTGRQRIMFPGDIRDYGDPTLPHFTGITHLFAHVWLGRRNALNLPCAPYVEDFARFMLSFGAEKIFLAHLMEAARPLEDLWTYQHAGMVMDAMVGMNPAADVSVPMHGRRIDL